MRVLLVYPEMPVTYWSYRYALRFIGKKAALPPLGLITIAAMLPESYDVKLIDMNTTPLRDSDIMDADLVMTSSMIVQKASLEKIIARCNRVGKPIVAGGPYPTNNHQTIKGVDHFVLNEAEVTLPLFLRDFESGRAQRVYTDETKPDVTQTPVPRFDLLKIKNYASMALQYSRGCPFSCEFCDIVAMFGHRPRTKTPDQFVREMDAVYRHGYRGSLFVVDDNFIGNKKEVKHLLPAVEQWQKKNNFPFGLFTEASVNLAEDAELMDMMVGSGFNMVFLGIETPVKESLVETHKLQNTRSDLLESVHEIQRRGMEVTGGFIVGFDNDPEDIFERQIDFIQKSGIPSAMVGLLTALPNTELHKRLKSEKRLVGDSSGNNTHDLQLNFRPVMDVKKLLSGYKHVIRELYRPDHYFRRCMTLIKNMPRQSRYRRQFGIPEIRALVFSLLRQTFSSYGFRYVRFMIRVALTRPSMVGEAIALSVKGHHFIKITREVIAVDEFKAKLSALSDALHAKLENITSEEIKVRLKEMAEYRDRVMRELKTEYRKISIDFQPHVEETLRSFEVRIDDLIVQLAGLHLVPIRSDSA